MERDSAITKMSRSVANESVQVVVRCRPINNKELRSDCTSVVQVYPSRGVIEVENPKSRADNESNKIFTYDAVYDPESTQQSLYDETVRPLVASVMEGYNGCVFAYGQTGTGKTFTMEGNSDNADSEESKGVIPRAFEQIWAHINRTTGTEFLVSVRYLEIYMENIRDLLKAKSTKSLELREMAGKGVFVSHLHSQTCQSAADMLKAMRLGNTNRTTGATNMNEHSSRSHAIFQIVVEMVQADSRTAKVGKLNLIDLAGSERQSKTGASGDRLKEATKINKSLSALGNVIFALAENSAHIPYRDSKLTRLLQDSLGGNSKTIMIANVGPASMNYDETIITLRYAYRAKSIKNQPIKNEDIKDAKLLELQDEIERLRQLIAEKSNGKLSAGGDWDDESILLESESESSDDDDKNARLHQLESSKMEVDELGKKLRQLEKQMVHGGKNIVDSVNENEVRLENHKAEIAARKKREIEMQQQLELEEESCMEIKQRFANVQQEVEYKREMLKKLQRRLQGLRQEIKDNQANYLKDRRELEEANYEASTQLRQKLLILENFIPGDERARLLALAYFDENADNWRISTERKQHKPSERPIAHAFRRPVTDYALQKAIPSSGVRYRSENVLDLKLDLPLRTTQEYQRPAICPQVKAAVQSVIAQDEANCHVVIGAINSSVGSTRASTARSSMVVGHGMTKAELETRYKKAARNTIDIRTNRLREVSKSAKSVY